MYQAVLDVRILFQLFDDGRNFHEIGPGSHHAHQFDHRESPATFHADDV
jgi:hypothetical protein